MDELLLTQKEIDVIDSKGVVQGDIVPYLQAQLAKAQEHYEVKIEEIRGGLDRLTKKLDDREDDLIQAKKEERERIIKILEDALENDFVMAIADPEGETMESTIDPNSLREILQALKGEQ